MAPLPKPTLDARLLGAHRVSAATDDALFAACGVRVAFTGRAGGASEGPYASLNLGGHVGDDPACVEANRARALEALGGAGLPLVVPNQVHGTHVVVVRTAAAADVQRAREEAAAGADALVVAAPGVAVLLNFADCLPLVLVAPGGAFAVAHAGWRGALGGVAGAAARALAEASGQDPAGFNAYIGPYIHAGCFQTGADVRDAFVAAYGEGVLGEGGAAGVGHAAGAGVGAGHAAEAGEATETGAAGNVNLARAVVVDLRRARVDPARIADLGACTVCRNGEYFSYRAQGGTCGRHGAIAFTL